MRRAVEAVLALVVVLDHDEIVGFCAMFSSASRRSSGIVTVVGH